MERLSDKKKELYWGLGKEARVSVTNLVGRDLCFYDYKQLLIKGEPRVLVKFAFHESETTYHTFITGSTVIADRLLRDTPNLPFIATIKQKGRYLYYE